MMHTVYLYRCTVYSTFSPHSFLPFNLSVTVLLQIRWNRLKTTNSVIVCTVRVKGGPNPIWGSTETWSSIQIYVHIECISLFSNILVHPTVYFFCFSSVTNSTDLIISLSKLFESCCKESCIKNLMLRTVGVFAVHVSVSETR